MKEAQHPEWDIQPILAFEIEQKKGQGEDASVCLADPESRAVLIACLDGCGGAGAKKYVDAENWTGARVASFSCGRALVGWYRQNAVDRLGMQNYPAQTIAKSLAQAMRENIDVMKGTLSPGSDRMIVSSMIRPFPTTLSCAILEKRKGDARCLFLWAGDSRGFVLTRSGMTQVTIDDLKDQLDPFDNIERDGVLANVISGKPFYVNARDVTLSEPCLVLTATDGCFSYFLSPMEFEHTILRTLSESNSLSEWQSLLMKEIGAVASDDYTMEALSFGFDSFDRLRAYFAPTLKNYEEIYGKRIAACRDRGELRMVWEAYKQFYMRSQI